MPGAAGRCRWWGQSSRAPGPGCSGWRNPGREGVRVPFQGWATGREGRGDSRFADITAGAGAAGGQQPPPTPRTRRRTRGPLSHRFLAPTPPVSGDLRMDGTRETLPRTQPGPPAPAPRLLLGSQKRTWQEQPPPLPPPPRSGLDPWRDISGSEGLRRAPAPGHPAPFDPSGARCSLANG